MLLLKRLVLGVCLVLLFVAGIMFVVLNDQPAQVDFALFQTPSFNLGLWLLAALGLGVLIGLFSSSFSLLRLKARNRQLAKDRQSPPREVQALLQDKQ